MTKVVVIEAHGIEAIKGDYSHECHREDCQDVAKKTATFFDGYNADSIEEAKAIYESNNEDLIAEGGSGYDWTTMVKVYPCAAK